MNGPRIRTLIVDDEPLARERVRLLLEREEDLSIVGESSDGLSALADLRRLKPDLVFLDIQMPGLDGFGVLSGLDAEEMPLVVFVTAYDRYALTAFQVHAVDYLLKPFEEERLHEAVAWARKTLADRTPGPDSRLLALLDELEARRGSPISRFTFKDGDRLVVLKSREVECIQATGNYMHVYAGGKSYLLRETLGSLEARLDPKSFVRTHRSWVVNLDCVQEFLPWRKGCSLLLLRSGRKIPLSPHHKPPFLALLLGHAGQEGGSPAHS